MDETEVRQLEPALMYHYTHVQAVAATLGPGYAMLYQRLKQASQCLLHARS